MKTTTLETLKTALNNKKVSYEITESEIGIKIKNTWYWFTNEFFTFKRSYNTNNGNTCKGLIHGAKSRKRIEKKLGLEL